jgi:hypothetical protein
MWWELGYGCGRRCRRGRPIRLGRGSGSKDQRGSCLSGSGQRGAEGGEGDWFRRSPRSPHREIAVRAGVLVGEQGVSPVHSPLREVAVR